MTSHHGVNSNPPKGASPDGFESELDKAITDFIGYFVGADHTLDGAEDNYRSQQILHDHLIATKPKLIAQILSHHANSLKGAVQGARFDELWNGIDGKNMPRPCPGGEDCVCDQINSESMESRIRRRLATLSAESEAHDG